MLLFGLQLLSAFIALPSVAYARFKSGETVLHVNQCWPRPFAVRAKGRTATNGRLAYQLSRLCNLRAC
eukprot:2081166-Pleurochrysis_carterae.AAC.1